MFDVGTPRDQERLFGDTGRRETHFLPPLSRNEPANDMRLCFTRYSFGVWDRHSAPQSSRPIDHSPETRNPATSLKYTQI